MICDLTAHSVWFPPPPLLINDFLLFLSTFLLFICVGYWLDVQFYVREQSSLRAQSWLNSIFQLHGQANQPKTSEPLFPEDRRGQVPQQRCTGITSLIWERKYASSVCVSWMYTDLKQEGGCVCAFISSIKKNELCVECKAQVTTNHSPVCVWWNIRLLLAPDSEDNTPPPSPSSHLPSGVGWNKRMREQRQEGGGGGGIEDADTDFFMERWERVTVPSTCGMRRMERRCKHVRGHETLDSHSSQ